MSNLPQHPEDPRGVPAATEGLREALVAPLSECTAMPGVLAAVVYLAEPGRSRLKAAMIQGSVPFLFGMPDTMPADAGHASATAWRTGRFTVVGVPVPEPGTVAPPRLIPFPYAAVSAPLVSGGGARYGALTLIRLLAPGGNWAADPAQEAALTGVARRLTERLDALAASGAAITPGPNVVLVAGPDGEQHAGAAGWGAPGVPGSAGLSLMYQVHNLSTRLTQLTSLDEIIPAVMTRVMAPFGARGIVVGQVTGERLWIVGSSGVSTSLVRELHGADVAVGSPWADSLLTHFPRFFDSPAALRRDYPGAYDGDDSVRGWAFLPLCVGCRPVGVCCLTFGEERSLTTEERAALMMLADLLASAVERARLEAYEHTLAESLQRTLLPRSLTALPGVITTARYVPARTEAGLGGDWYDVLPLPDGRLALIVGDVEGHSTDSAIVMGQLRSAVMAYVKEGHDPAAVLSRAGRLLSDLDTGLVATCCLAFLNLEDGVVEAARAGHPAPLLRRPDGRLEHLDLVAGRPLGLADAAGTNSSAVVPPGSTLMLYTDGMYQARTGDFFPRTLDLLARDDADLEELADRLVETAADGHDDDLILLLARFEGGVAGASRRIEQLELPRHDLAGVAAARRFVHDCLRRWDATEISDALELITSEAVTNALIHADSAVDVRVREYDDRVRLEVRDSDAHPPLPSAISVCDEAAQSTAEHGRGLMIVDSLATAWGSSPHGRGKTVWMELRLGPRGSRQPGTASASVG
ncbi:SpoIIE family protein phosphatase [Streptomyces naganishii]|uniref:ATP-binding SpoIIE family protein phosphatase n=1 Tax=Streptomyces naganishii TaxID=285447 RepID=UPI00368A6512